jgi:hypothetical protein
MKNADNGIVEGHLKKVREDKDFYYFEEVGALDYPDPAARARQCVAFARLAARAPRAATPPRHQVA